MNSTVWLSKQQRTCRNRRTYNCKAKDRKEPHGYRETNPNGRRTSDTLFPSIQHHDLLLVHTYMYIWAHRAPRQESFYTLFRRKGKDFKSMSWSSVKNIILGSFSSRQLFIRKPCKVSSCLVVYIYCKSWSWRLWMIEGCGLYLWVT